jgi:hypothetical protein
MGEDWATQGNWVGHYGRQAAVLCGAASPGDHRFIRYTSKYSARPELLTDLNDKPRSWIQTLVSEDVRALYDPQVGTRRIAAWDDHGETYRASHDGPGLGVVVQVPEGLHRISAYFLNDNGHSGDNRRRDYELFLQRKALGDSWQTEAHGRVGNFWGGVYKQFAVNGPGPFRLVITKGTSFNVMCAGVFMDTLADGYPPLTGQPPLWMANILMGPKALPESQLPKGSSLVDVCARLSAAANMGPKGSGVWRNGAMQLYRTGVSEKAPEELLSRWRWSLALWNGEARQQFDRTAVRAWKTMQEWNPSLQNKTMRPNSPGTK